MKRKLSRGIAVAALAVPMVIGSAGAASASSASFVSGGVFAGPQGAGIALKGTSISHHHVVFFTKGVLAGPHGVVVGGTAAALGHHGVMERSAYPEPRWGGGWNHRHHWRHGRHHHRWGHGWGWRHHRGWGNHGWGNGNRGGMSLQGRGPAL